MNCVIYIKSQYGPFSFKDDSGHVTDNIDQRTLELKEYSLS
jgi:hypothetical protein